MQIVPMSADSNAIDPPFEEDGRLLDSSASPKALDAYLALHRGIRSGAYPPGSRLKEVELAAHLQMSRTPVREAIRQLERDGVVLVLPNRGAVVRELTEREIDDTYSLRAVLEGYAASRAAIRMEPAALSRLEAIQEQLETQVGDEPDADFGVDGDVEALIALNQAFHQTIMVGSQNSRMAEILQKATEVPLHMKQLYWRAGRARAGALVHHREVLEALRAHDPLRADAVMRTHVYAVKDFFIQQYRVVGLRRLVGGEGSGGRRPSEGSPGHRGTEEER